MSSPIFLFIIILFTMEFAIYCYGRNSSFGCVPREKKALLKFKASLSDPSGRLSSWDNDHTDCCTWDGVMCDESTGHVISLDLRNTNGAYGSNIDAVPQSLGNLSSLELLDLSNIDLSRTKNLIEVLGILPSLSTLDLSGTSLDNTHLPHTCQNSTLFPYIEYLDLSSNSFEGELPCFLHNMNSLRFLNLSNNWFNSSEHLHRLRARNLVYLDLSYNSFPQTVDWIFELVQDKCHLKSLNLGNNLLYGDITELFNNLSGCFIDKLELLGLGGNNFHGNLPEELGELKQIKYLDLSSNNLSGKIPTSLGQLLNLEYISIFNNTISGWIPSSLGNLSKLKFLFLGSNQLSGEIPTSLGQLSNLEHLSISSNKISGSIPSSLGNLSALKFLFLDYNELSGEVPTSLGQLSNVEVINFSENSFNSSLSEAHFAKLSRLDHFSAGDNLIKFNVRLDWEPSFQLLFLDLHSCYIGGQFPQWLQTQKKLDTLDMSNCSISGNLPDWLQNLNLRILYLSDNHIAGPIPKLASSMRVLDLSNNTINHLPRDIGHMMPFLQVLTLVKNSVTGSIPDSLCEMKTLRTLDLSNNYVSGHLPDCWENFLSLMVLRLSSNKLSGIIPNNIGAAYSLQRLHLDNNNFTGQFPSSLKNCTNLVLVDIGENKLTGMLPEWKENDLPNLKAFGLRDNELYGIIPSSFCQMSQLKIIDLANNRLTGQIPHCFGDFIGMINGSQIKANSRWFDENMGQVIKGTAQDFTSTLSYLVNLDLSSNNLIGEIPSELTNLSALIGLNLSHNHLEWKIPANIGDMKSLQSLDLSSNNLSGTIPRSLADLNFLSHLNLSNNNLSGQIPTGNQLQTFENPSMYEGNPNLCGAPLLKRCHNDRASKVPNVEKRVGADHEDDRAERIYLYGVIVSGFATGFWGIIGVLYFKRSWREAIFRFTEVAFGKMWRS